MPPGRKFWFHSILNGSVLCRYPRPSPAALELVHCAGSVGPFERLSLISFLPSSAIWTKFPVRWYFALAFPAKLLKSLLYFDKDNIRGQSVRQDICPHDRLRYCEYRGRLYFCRSHLTSKINSDKNPYPNIKPLEKRFAFVEI